MGGVSLTTEEESCQSQEDSETPWAVSHTLAWAVSWFPLLCALIKQLMAQGPANPGDKTPTFSGRYIGSFAFLYIKEDIELKAR